MLYGLVSLIGVLIALMIAFNGKLGLYLSVFEVSLIIHMIGLLVILIAMWLKKERPVFKGIPLYFYIAGVIGAFLTAIDAYVVGVIGVTLAVTLSTVSQLVSSAAIDFMGIGQLKKIPFNIKRTMSLGLMVVGILFMLLGR